MKVVTALAVVCLVSSVSSAPDRDRRRHIIKGILEQTAGKLLGINNGGSSAQSQSFSIGGPLLGLSISSSSAKSNSGGYSGAQSSAGSFNQGGSYNNPAGNFAGSNAASQASAGGYGTIPPKRPSYGQGSYGGSFANANAGSQNGNFGGFAPQRPESGFGQGGYGPDGVNSGHGGVHGGNHAGGYGEVPQRQPGGAFGQSLGGGYGAVPPKKPPHGDVYSGGQFSGSISNSNSQSGSFGAITPQRPEYEQGNNGVNSGHFVAKNTGGYGGIPPSGHGPGGHTGGYGFNKPQNAGNFGGFNSASHAQSSSSSSSFSSQFGSSLPAGGHGANGASFSGSNAASHSNAGSSLPVWSGGYGDSYGYDKNLNSKTQGTSDKGFDALFGNTKGFSLLTPAEKPKFSSNSHLHHSGLSYGGGYPSKKINDLHVSNAHDSKTTVVLQPVIVVVNKEPEKSSAISKPTATGSSNYGSSSTSFTHHESSVSNSYSSQSAATGYGSSTDISTNKGSINSNSKKSGDVLVLPIIVGKEQPSSSISVPAGLSDSTSFSSLTSSKTVNKGSYGGAVSGYSPLPAFAEVNKGSSTSYGTSKTHTSSVATGESSFTEAGTPSNMPIVGYSNPLPTNAAKIGVGKGSSTSYESSKFASSSAGASGHSLADLTSSSGYSDLKEKNVIIPVFGEVNKGSSTSYSSNSATSSHELTVLKPNNPSYVPAAEPINPSASYGTSLSASSFLEKSPVSKGPSTSYGGPSLPSKETFASSVSGQESEILEISPSPGALPVFGSIGKGSSTSYGSSKQSTSSSSSSSGQSLVDFEPSSSAGYPNRQNVALPVFGSVSKESSTSYSSNSASSSSTGQVTGFTDLKPSNSYAAAQPNTAEIGLLGGVAKGSTGYSTSNSASSSVSDEITGAVLKPAPTYSSTAHKSKIPSSSASYGNSNTAVSSLSTSSFQENSPVSKRPSASYGGSSLPSVSGLSKETSTSSSFSQTKEVIQTAPVPGIPDYGNVGKGPSSSYSGSSVNYPHSSAIIFEDTPRNNYVAKSSSAAVPNPSRTSYGSSSSKSTSVTTVAKSTGALGSNGYESSLGNSATSPVKDQGVVVIIEPSANPIPSYASNNGQSTSSLSTSSFTSTHTLNIEVSGNQHKTDVLGQGEPFGGQTPLYGGYVNLGSSKAVSSLNAGYGQGGGHLAHGGNLYESSRKNGGDLGVSIGYGHGHETNTDQNHLDYNRKRSPTFGASSSSTFSASSSSYASSAGAPYEPVPQPLKVQAPSPSPPCVAAPVHKAKHGGSRNKFNEPTLNRPAAPCEPQQAPQGEVIPVYVIDPFDGDGKQSDYEKLAPAIAATADKLRKRGQSLGILAYGADYEEEEDEKP